jgi:hypothetical protein
MLVVGIVPRNQVRSGGRGGAGALNSVALAGWCRRRAARAHHELFRQVHPEAGVWVCGVIIIVIIIIIVTIIIITIIALSGSRTKG